MLDSAYDRWFARKTAQVIDVTWCAAAEIDDVLTAYGIPRERTRPARLNADSDLRMLIGRLGKGTVTGLPRS